MPGDVFIALDPGPEYFQPFLFNYGGNLYQLIPGARPAFPTPGSIQMWKSTNAGATWTALSSTVLSQATQSVACCLLGTKLYIFYQTSVTSSFAGLLAYFDFTVDAFTAVTTTGTVPQPDTSFIAGPDALHLYLVNTASFTGITVGEFVSNTYSSIGSLSTGIGSNVLTATAILFGSSGILHVLYTISPLGSQSAPSSLAYCNVQSGSLVGTTGSTVVLSAFSDGWADGYPGTCSQPVQIGSNILLSYYDPTAQQVMLLSFNDVASPTFTTTAIDGSFPITTATVATGAWTTLLALFGSTLYCFYTNYSGNNNGDGWLYFRTSSDGGVTWSARKQAVQHIDPQDLTPFTILVPDVCQLVGGTPLGSILPLSYRQNSANSHGNYANGRFFFGYPLVVAKNYVF